LSQQVIGVLIRAALPRTLRIERFVNKIKQCRRVATRYDKLAANYLAFIKLASIRIWSRANEPAS
jgi:transposase